MKVYIFGGSKENPNWYYTECKIDSKPFVGWDKETRRFYCNFIADHRNHIGHFYVLSLWQMIVLLFKHRLYFTEKKAKARQTENYRNKSIIPQDM